MVRVIKDENRDLVATSPQLFRLNNLGLLTSAIITQQTRSKEDGLTNEEIAVLPLTRGVAFDVLKNAKEEGKW